MVFDFREFKLGKEDRFVNDFLFNIESVIEYRGRGSWFFVEIIKVRNLVFIVFGFFIYLLGFLFFV